MFETVVIATDGSESTERAIEAAFDLTERFDADLHALTVIDAENEEEKREQRTAASAVLDDLAARTDREVHTVVRDGDPATVICSYAAQVDADVIITGTRGRDGPHKFHLGSVAEAVVHECPVPVLTVRQLDHTAESSPTESSPTESSNTESTTTESSNVDSSATDGNHEVL